MDCLTSLRGEELLWSPTQGWNILPACTLQSLIRITQEKVCEADFEKDSRRIYNVAEAVTFTAPHSLHPVSNSGNLFGENIKIGNPQYINYKLNKIKRELWGVDPKKEEKPKAMKRNITDNSTWSHGSK